MSRQYSPSFIGLSALISLALACNKSDRPKTTSESVGATTPVVSASVEPTGTGTSVAPVTYESAEATFRTGHYDQAAQLFTTYTESHPDNPWGYYMLGLATWKSGDPSGAGAAFDRALQLDPNHRKSWFNSARVQLELDRPKEALGRIERALALEPMSGEGLRLMGRAKYQLGDVEQAVDAYHRALALDARDVWAMNNLGLIYIEQGRSPEALPPLARAIELRSNSPVFQNNLGTALERSGYPIEAAKAYEAAIGIDSSYQKASISLARITGSSVSEESTSVDLGALAAQFRAEIETWRDAISPTDSTPPDSVTGEPQAAPDTTVSGITGLSDSSRASVEAVTDTLEDCAGENE
jgi:predicted Zn-dependent protease